LSFAEAGRCRWRCIAAERGRLDRHAQRGRQFIL
jgi:hypothetical protein